MAPPTCVSCGRAFRANDALASLPDGRRIAFDTEHHRVWRICTHCREWNLLGAESAAAVLPEAAAQFTASVTGGGSGITVARVGQRLEILRVGDQEALVAGALALADRHRELGQSGTMLAVFLVSAILLLGAAVLAGYGPAAWLIPMLIAQFGAMRFATGIRSQRLGISHRGRMVAVSALLILAGSAGAVGLGFADAGNRILTIALTCLGFAVYGVATEWLTNTLTQQRLPSGRRIRVSLPMLRAMTLRWTPGASTMELTPHGQRPLDATDSVHVLTHVTEWTAGFPSDAIEQARALVSTTTSLSDVLALLPRDVGATHGVLRLDDLPYTYWAALDLALSRLERGTHGIETAREAREVAEIAERLDEELT